MLSLDVRRWTVRINSSVGVRCLGGVRRQMLGRLGRSEAEGSETGSFGDTITVINTPTERTFEETRYLLASLRRSPSMVARRSKPSPEKEADLILAGSASCRLSAVEYLTKERFQKWLCPVALCFVQKHACDEDSILAPLAEVNYRTRCYT